MVNSRRWKIGNFFYKLYRKVLFKSLDPPPQEHLDKIRTQFKTWEKSDGNLKPARLTSLEYKKKVLISENKERQSKLNFPQTNGAREKIGTEPSQAINSTLGEINNEFTQASTTVTQETQDTVEQLQAQFHQPTELQQAYGKVEAMKTSKFRELQTLWFKSKLKNYHLLTIIRHKFGSLVKRKPIASEKEKEAKYQEFPQNHKHTISTNYQVALDNFLASESKLNLPPHEAPLVTIILVLYNRAELTFQCLRSLAEVSEDSAHPFEVVLVDNASSDQTSAILERLEGVTIIRNAENLNFLLACNQAAQVARGEYLLFLNNDAQLLPGSLASALQTIRGADDIGAVGGKIILLDGSLQEAGSLVWKDGSCLGYGRGDSPFAPMYMFRRDVDFCSGAFLLTRRELFEAVGGFDEDYKPAYYEETDYCLKLWHMGKRVVYDPEAIILHFEFASSQSTEAAIALQKAHQQILVNKHFNQLQSHYVPQANHILPARTARRHSHRVLFIDDRVPHSFLGSGFPRARDILQSLVDLDCLVTFYPLSFCQEDWQAVYQDIPRVVEVMVDYGTTHLKQFLQQRAGFYHTILVSRPHNMRLLQPILANHPEWFTNTKIIYDAEAIYALRETQQRRLAGKNVSDAAVDALVQKEVKVAEKADTIIAVSKREQERFLQRGFNSVHTLGHTVPIMPTEVPLEQRADILFVGAIHEKKSPNADSVLWFVEQVLPKIQDKLGFKVKLIIAGYNNIQKVFDLQSDSVQVLGKVEDLTEFYNSARIFVAPTRFAAGIPFKAHHAAAHGLPMVTTSLIASQLDWQDGVELLAADDPETFAEQCVKLYNDLELWQKLREYALRRIKTECSREAFVTDLRKIFQIATKSSSMAQTFEQSASNEKDKDDTLASQNKTKSLTPPIQPAFYSQFGGLWTDLNTAKDILRRKLDLNQITPDKFCQIEHWIDWGYVIVPAAVEEENIDALVEDIDLTLQEKLEPRKVSYWKDGIKNFENADYQNMQKGESKLLGLHMTSTAAKKVIFTEKIQRLLHLILEGPALAFQSLTFLYGSQQPVHQDSAFVLVDSPLELIASWVALEDIEEGSGELVYYPGSHRIPEVLFQGKYKWASPGSLELKNYSNKLHERAQAANLKLQHFKPKKGDVLLWSADLIHGGAKRRNLSTTRKSIVTHYCPADRQPMYSYGNQKFKQFPCPSGDYVCSKF
jgi:GT2 family glycosyltransferase